MIRLESSCLSVTSALETHSGFKEAVDDPGWCDAINSELKALEKNERRHDWLFKMDVSNAFLLEDLLEDVYMQVPMGYVGKGEPVQNVKTHFTQALLSFGFQESKANYSLFTKIEGGSFKAVYMDDLMITSNDSVQIQKLKRQLNYAFHMKDGVNTNNA
ncbi:retrovirus-related pol polyprotein from transposon TNT 1-94 [Tanacetum coccineum]|uniref:Retrovirus-related pol polyprotein from transposon TNT 1-94 n=1 Tax=Tanacetum coccineum TaxID=301880 RepID=A0ABQ5J9W9_9ASTR